MTLPLTSPFTSGSIVTKAQLDALVNSINALARGLINETSAGAAVTLSTTGTAAFASSSKITFTLTATRRVRIVVSCRFAPSGSTGRFNIEPGYNSGGSINLGSATFVGQPNSVAATSTTQASAQSEATALLTAGTWTAFAGVGRISGGTATDQADTFYIAVYDEGDS